MRNFSCPSNILLTIPYYTGKREMNPVRTPAKDTSRSRVLLLSEKDRQGKRGGRLESILASTAPYLS